MLLHSNSGKIGKYSTVVCPKIRCFSEQLTVSATVPEEPLSFTAVLFLHKLPQMHCHVLNDPFDVCILHIFVCVIHVHVNSIPSPPWCLEHLYINTLLLLQARYIQNWKHSSLSQTKFSSWLLLSFQPLRLEITVSARMYHAFYFVFPPSSMFSSLVLSTQSTSTSLLMYC